MNAFGNLRSLSIYSNKNVCCDDKEATSWGFLQFLREFLAKSVLFDFWLLLLLLSISFRTKTKKKSLFLMKFSVL